MTAILKPLWVACIFAASCLSCLAHAGDDNTLVMLNWPEYIDFDVVKKFEQQTGSLFRMVLFETDEARDELLAETGGHGYDISQITCDRVNGYAKQGWLAPMSVHLVPNMNHIGKRWLTEFPGIANYAAPFHWGTLGIAYRPDLLGEKITRWLDLLKPSERLRQKILMEKDSRNLAGMALKANGYSWNAHDKKAVKAATDTLIAQRPYVKAYGYPSMDKNSGLVTGEIWAATIYNGDVRSLQAFEPRIAYVVPDEGALLWMDCLAVLAQSKKKEQAYAFINFLHTPDNAAQTANTLHYAPTNQAAIALMPPDFLNDQMINPPADVLRRSEFFAEQWPLRVERDYKKLLNGLINTVSEPSIH